VGEALVNASTGEVLSLTDIDLLHKQGKKLGKQHSAEIEAAFSRARRASSCLPACLRMVLSAYGVEASEQDLRKACRWDPLLATSSTAVVMAARQMGFKRSHEDYGLRLYDLHDLLRRDVFPILSVSQRSTTALWADRQPRTGGCEHHRRTH